MSTIAEQLAALAQIKEDIRQAIISQGVDVGINEPFGRYADLIEDISVGGDGGSTMFIHDDLSSKAHYVDLDTDSRFEITYSGDPWEYKSLFTYDGHNMYSAPQIDHGATTSVSIKNVSGSMIFLVVVYKSSTEGANYDYGTITNYDRTVVTNIGGSASGETDVIMLANNGVLVFSYRKDGSTASGLDNVGMLVYEVGV